MVGWQRTGNRAVPLLHAKLAVCCAAYQWEGEVGSWEDHLRPVSVWMGFCQLDVAGGAAHRIRSLEQRQSVDPNRPRVLHRPCEGERTDAQRRRLPQSRARRGRAGRRRLRRAGGSVQRDRRGERETMTSLWESRSAGCRLTRRIVTRTRPGSPYCACFGAGATGSRPSGARRMTPTGMCSSDAKKSRLVIWEQEIAGSNPARPTNRHSVTRFRTRGSPGVTGGEAEGRACGTPE